MVNTRREPGTRRQSRGTGGGLPLEKGTARAVLGSTCRRKAFWIDEIAVLDVAVAEAVLGSSNEAGRKAGRARGATESVRGPSPASYAVDNAAARWRSPIGIALWVIRVSRLAQDEGSKRTEAEVVPSSTPHSGSGRRKAGRRRVELGLKGRSTSRSTKAQVVVTREPNDRGCTCRGEVAEVGEEHLPRARRGEPRGEPSEREVERRGGRARDEAAPPPRRVKGCMAERANVTVSEQSRPRARSGNRP